MAVVIFWASSRQVPVPIAYLIALSDKLFHGVAYATLAAALAFAIRRAHRTSPRRTAVLAGVLASLYGATDEWHQLYVPSRSAESLDILADTMGASVAALVAWWILRRREQRRSARENADAPTRSPRRS